MDLLHIKIPKQRRFNLLHVLAWLSPLPCYQWHLACLADLNPDKIYAPVQGIGEEYGSTAPQRHSQPLGH